MERVGGGERGTGVGDKGSGLPAIRPNALSD